MHAAPGTPRLSAVQDHTPPVVHEWVGAAVVGLGHGATPRAEHAARTGRHVLNTATRIEVLEVYCGRCRLAYGPYADRRACSAAVTRVG